MRTFKGCTKTNPPVLIGIITRENKPFYDRHNYIKVTENISFDCLGYKACISIAPINSLIFPHNIALLPSEISLLADGDIVSIQDDAVSVLWEKDSTQNALLITESCNCKCLMCPQPPRKHNSRHIDESLKILNLIKGTQQHSICITGGEPTLLGDTFWNILKKCIQEHPESNIYVLTNGKRFNDSRFVHGFTDLDTSNVVWCVSLHSDIDTIHDEIVGVKGSHEETELGIYNLARRGMRIEIRHVVTRKNFTRLPKFAEYLYSYFPFCSHYAIMAMEACGYAEENFEKIHVNPHEYKELLASAVTNMYLRGLPVSVYNVPLCLCKPTIRSFARQSISSWKNKYLPQCDGCFCREQCAGFFGTSCKLPEKHIQPIKE